MLKKIILKRRMKETNIFTSIRYKKKINSSMNLNGYRRSCPSDKIPITLSEQRGRKERKMGK